MYFQALGKSDELEEGFATSPENYCVSSNQIYHEDQSLAQVAYGVNFYLKTDLYIYAGEENPLIC